MCILSPSPSSQWQLPTTEDPLVVTHKLVTLGDIEYAKGECRPFLEGGGGCQGGSLTHLPLPPTGTRKHRAPVPTMPLIRKPRSKAARQARKAAQARMAGGAASSGASRHQQQHQQQQQQQQHQLAPQRKWPVSPVTGGVAAVATRQPSAGASRAPSSSWSYRFPDLPAGSAPGSASSWQSASLQM